MKPTHPVELLVCAIATQERPAGDHTRNNPGDLRYAKQANASAPGWDGTGVPPIATFSAWQAGIAALFRDIWAKVAAGMTTREIIYVFAPPNENDTAVYLHNVLNWTGLQADVKVLDALPDLWRMTV